MSAFTLALGNRNYSSWSMRAWLAARQTGALFDEKTIWFHEDTDRSQRLRYSPAGRVPVLLDRELAVWDSLAITELLAERYPEAGLWPTDPVARARARSLCCEMHSGFEDLRRALPLNCRARKPYRDRGPGVASDVRRIAEMWTETRAEFGAGGPFLFGACTAADAFYAPVASRFRTYGVPLTGAAGDYAEHLLASPPVSEWLAAAEQEPHQAPEYDTVN